MFMSRESVENMINQTNGPFLEVGGPTQHFPERPSIDFGKIDKPLIVSNIEPNYVREGWWHSPLFGDHFGTEPPKGWKARTYRFMQENYLQADDFSPVVHKLDLVADATALPIATGALGALYASKPQSSMVPGFLGAEAPRVLEPGGILVIEKIKKEDAKTIPPYFDVVRSNNASHAGRAALNMVLRRNEIPYKVSGSGPDNDA